MNVQLVLCPALCRIDGKTYFVSTEADAQSLVEVAARFPSELKIVGRVNVEELLALNTLNAGSGDQQQMLRAKLHNFKATREVNR